VTKILCRHLKLHIGLHNLYMTGPFNVRVVQATSETFRLPASNVKFSRVKNVLNSTVYFSAQPAL